MAKRGKRRLPVSTCLICGVQYTKVHQCLGPVADWQCQYCNQNGYQTCVCQLGQNQSQWHNDDDCNNFGYRTDTFNFSHANPAFPNPYESVKLEEFCETMGRGDSCDTVYDGAPQQDVKQERHINPGMCNTKKRRAEHSDPCNDFQRQKRRRHNNTLNFFKGRVETLREENNILKQQCNSAMNVNASSSVETESETYRAYQNEAFTLDTPRGELIAEIARLKSQRDQLFEYTKKLVIHTRKVATRVDHLTAQHKYIMDHSYTGFPTANLPPWFRGTCKRCGSCQRHEEFDCSARGYMCQQCFKFNHFTAVCMDAPSHRFTATQEEKNMIAEVKDELTL